MIGNYYHVIHSTTLYIPTYMVAASSLCLGGKKFQPLAKHEVTTQQPANTVVKN